MPYSSEVLRSSGAQGKRNAFERFLATVEWLGNLLPHPVTLFAIFAVGIVVLSGVASWFDLSVAAPPS